MIAILSPAADLDSPSQKQNAPFLEIRFQSFPSYQSQCAARQCVATDG